MKKKLALILSAVMLTMTLAACGEEKSISKDRDDDTAKTSLAAIDSGSDGESTLSTPEVSESISAQISEDTICILRAYEEWVYAPPVLNEAYDVTTYYTVRFKDASAPSEPSFDNSPYLDFEEVVVFPNAELADRAYGDYTGDNEVSISGGKVTIKFAYPPTDDVWYGIDFLEQAFRNRGYTITEVYKG